MNKVNFWILFLCHTLAFSQQEASVWYFGQNAGLKFLPNGTVVPLSDGQLNTEEGCSAIADASGNLLFYTDGRTVWDRNHIAMPNGSFLNGTELFGDASSTQSAIIVPKPNDPNIYYIFTVDEPHHQNALAYPNAFVGGYSETDSGSVPDFDDGRNNGFNYSIVDLSFAGSNGSMGDIVSRNNHLVTYDTNPSGEEIKFKCGEKITAIKKEADGSYWVITHFVNRFYAFRVTDAGVVTTPVVSTVGSNQTLLGYRRNAIGYLKASPDGTKLALAHQQNGVVLGDFELTSGNVELFNFDGNTGVVSDPIIVVPNIQGYGVEFSPNSEKLYATYRVNGDPNMELSQFDLTVADIPNSKVILYNQENYLFALQLAPNNKIYCATGYLGTLGVINNPDANGTLSNYVQVGQPLVGGTIVKLGLPPFITSFFNASFTAQDFCLGTATQFTLTSTTPVTSAIWNFGDGSPTVNLVNPSHTYANDGNYTVTVTATSVNGTVTRSKSITISAVPVIANTISNKTVCGSANMNYDLSQFTTPLLGSQSATVFGVAYFSTSADAVNHVNQLPINYVLPLGTTVFHAKIYNLSNVSCYVLTSFSVALFQQPVANALSDYVICESLPYDNLEQFDLSTKNSSLLNGQNTADFITTYHGNSADATSGSNALPILYTNTLPQEVLYARITNVLNSNCFATTSLNIKVVQQPIVSTVTDFVQCDDPSNDGIALFDLSQKTNEILNGQSSAVFQVYYYLSLDDAQNDVNRIVAPLNNTSANQLIYYRIEAIGNSNCSAISNFKLVVSRKPEANAPSNYFQCDDVANDGLAFFNLNSVSSSVIGNQNASQFSVSYHLTQSDAYNGGNALATAYQNVSNPQTVFVRIENNQNTTCFSTTSFQIGLYQMPIAHQPHNLFVCDDESNDGKAVFDLSQQDDSILGVQDEADFVITYHGNLSDAQLGLNALSTNFTSATNEQVIYGRIENKLSSTCFAVTSFTLFVKPKPILLLSDSYSICEGKTITVSAPPGFSSYSWSNGDTSSTTTFATANTYSLTVTEDYGDITCSTIKDVVVYNSNIATITKIITTDWTDNQNSITVEVSGDGDYEYSLNEVSFQSSATFSGLRSGDYTVCVNDIKGCGSVCEDVFLLNYPKFFTPNGDGVNDLWKIKNSFVEPNLQIQLFDRYGKLLSVFDGLDKGWDGTFNGTLLPADDYWFVVQRQNGKEFKGHFALKR